MKELTSLRGSIIAEAVYILADSDCRTSLRFVRNDVNVQGIVDHYTIFNILAKINQVSERKA